MCGTRMRNATTRPQPRGLTERGVVGKAGFEPAISRSRTERDTRLRYFPTSRVFRSMYRALGSSVPNRVLYQAERVFRVLRGPSLRIFSDGILAKQRD